MGNNSSAPAPTPKEPAPPPVLTPPADDTPPTGIPTTPNAQLVQEMLSQPPQDTELSNNPGTYEELHKKCKGVLFGENVLCITSLHILTTLHKHVLHTHMYLYSMYLLV